MDTRVLERTPTDKEFTPTPHHSPHRSSIKATYRVAHSLGPLEHDISRRAFERTRAELGRLGLIDHFAWMNSQYGERRGRTLSNGLSGALRLVADGIDAWLKDDRTERREQDEQLLGTLT